MAIAWTHSRFQFTDPVIQQIASAPKAIFSRMPSGSALRWILVQPSRFISYHLLPEAKHSSYSIATAQALQQAIIHSSPSGPVHQVNWLSQYSGISQYYLSSVQAVNVDDAASVCDSAARVEHRAAARWPDLSIADVYVPVWLCSPKSPEPARRLVECPQKFQGEIARICSKLQESARQQWVKSTKLMASKTQAQEILTGVSEQNKAIALSFAKDGWGTVDGWEKVWNELTGDSPSLLQLVRPTWSKYESH